VSYLGHVVSKDGLKADPGEHEWSKEWPRPKDNVRSFLGLTNYFRKFIKDYSNGLRRLGLTRLTKDNVAFEWAREGQSPLTN
jgi:hypothetical protein